MTITTNPSRDEYTSTAGQTVFNYTFKIYANTDLDVYVTPSGQEPNDSTDLTTDYVVDPGAIGDEAGGFITFNSPLNAGDAVTIVSSIPYDRTVDYQNNGDFLPTTVNNDNDRQVSQIKQILEQTGRTLQFPESLQSASTLTLPVPVSQNFLRWKTDLSGLENVELIDEALVVGNGQLFIYASTVELTSSVNSALVPGVNVLTQEFTAGNGGGGLYIVESGDTSNGLNRLLLNNGNTAVLETNGSIDLKQFGAAGDGVTDDTLAVQAAIDYAISLTTPVFGGQSLIPVIYVTGNHLLSSSITIDRPENQTGWFRIVRSGKVGGFTTNSLITLFSTTFSGSDRVTPANSQLTNQISFEGITFSSTVTGAYAIDATKFVRGQCLNCFFSAIAFNPDPGNSYIQSFYLDNCFARGVSANKFMQAEDAYDVKVTGSKFEVIGDTVIFFSVRALGCEFSANLAQNCGNNFINIAQTQGVSITGNYVEANDGRFLKIDDSRGTSCSGNFIQSTTANAGDTNFFEIQIGESLGFTALGNYFTGRGFDITGTSKIALIDQTNVASLALVNPGQAYTRRIEGSIEPRDGVYLGGAAATNLLNDYQDGSFTATLAPSGSGTITLTASSDTLTYTKIGSLVTIVGMIEVASVSSPVGTDIQLSTLPFTPVDGPELGGRFGGCVTWNQGGGTFTATAIQGLEGNTTLNIKGNAGTVAAGNQFYFSFSYRV